MDHKRRKEKCVLVVDPETIGQTNVRRVGAIVASDVHKKDIQPKNALILMVVLLASIAEKKGTSELNAPTAQNRVCNNPRTCLSVHRTPLRSIRLHSKLL